MSHGKLKKRNHSIPIITVNCNRIYLIFIEIVKTQRETEMTVETGAR